MQARSTEEVTERNNVEIRDITREDRAFLGRLLEEGKIKGVSFEGNCAKVTASHFVGLIALSNNTISVRPKIATSSVMYMVGKAGRLSPTFYSSLASVGPLDNLYDFVVEIFLTMSNDLVNRGIWKSYTSNEELLHSPRGRILVSPTIVQSKGLQGRLVCNYDEYTSDILENQLMKHTLLVINRIDHEPEHARSVTRLLSALSDVSAPQSVGPQSFERVVYNRLNEEYQPIHLLGELIEQNLSFTETGGRYGAYSFLIDMERLFQEYVKQGLLTRLLPLGMEVEGQAKQYAKKVSGPAPLLDANLIPDILVSKAGVPKLVADTKWVDPITVHASGNWTLDPDHLHQIIAYMAMVGTPGMLIYPQAAQGEILAEYNVGQAGSGKMRVFTLNLSRSTRLMDLELDRLASEVGQLAS